MPAIKPATELDRAKVLLACALIKEARDALRGAGSSRAADKAQRALKSAEGAYRHVCHRLTRSDPMIFVGDGQYRRRSACSPADLERARAMKSAANEGKL